jgi:hypothetical protein
MRTWLDELRAVPPHTFRRLAVAIPALESRLETLLTLGEEPSTSDEDHAAPPAHRSKTGPVADDVVQILNVPGVSAHHCLLDA